MGIGRLSSIRQYASFPSLIDPWEGETPVRDVLPICPGDNHSLLQEQETHRQEG